MFGGLLLEAALFIELQEEGLGGLPVQVGGGAVVDVEGDPEALEGVLDQSVVPVHDGLGVGAFLLGPDGDGGTMLIASADPQHFFAQLLKCLT